MKKILFLNLCSRIMYACIEGIKKKFSHHRAKISILWCDFCIFVCKKIKIHILAFAIRAMLAMRTGTCPSCVPFLGKTVTMLSLVLWSKLPIQQNGVV